MPTHQQELEALCQPDTFLSLPNKNIKKIIKLLDLNEIDTSFSIQLTPSHKGSLLEFAVATGSYALVKKVLEKIKNPHQRNQHDQSIWHHWAKGAYLLDKINNPHKKIYQGANRISLLATDLKSHASCDIASLFIDYGLKPLIKEPDDLGFTPMHVLLISAGDMNNVQFLFNHGASFLDKNILGETPISSMSDHLHPNSFLSDFDSRDKQILLNFSLKLKQKEESKLQQLKSLKKAKTTSRTQKKKNTSPTNESNRRTPRYKRQEKMM